MVRKEELIEIKKDPIRYRKHRERAKKYWKKLKKDPIRHKHWKEVHRIEHKKYYKNHKDNINKLAKEKYLRLTQKEKIQLIESTKERRILRRKKFIKQWGSKCQKCGYLKYPEILQFDHKIPLYRKTNNIKKVVSGHMLKEVRDYPDKFELLCPNCHTLKTRKEIVELWKIKNKIYVL